VVLLKDGTARWNDEPISESAVAAKVTEAVAKDPEMNLVVSADKQVEHGRVVHMLDIAKTAGVAKFAINVQGE
jgi:biopolymer transport protein ExbD